MVVDFRVLVACCSGPKVLGLALGDLGEREALVEEALVVVRPENRYLISLSLTDGWEDEPRGGHGDDLPVDPRELDILDLVDQLGLVVDALERSSRRSNVHR